MPKNLAVTLSTTCAGVVINTHFGSPEKVVFAGTKPAKEQPKARLIPGYSYPKDGNYVIRHVKYRI